MGRTSDARERLLESCQALMHEKGYTAVGVGEVCSRAGVNKGSFYYFFPSKQELALAVIDEFGAASSDQLSQVLESEAPPLERLERFFDASYRAHRESRETCGKLLGCPIGNLALEMGSQNEVLRERLRGVLDGQIDRFAAVLQEAIDRGDLPRQVARGTAASLMALIEGTLLLAKASDDTEVLRDLGRNAFRLIGAELNDSTNQREKGEAR
jgi:TetR/AcrR family transcriptional repressor of nem operon